MAEQSIGYPSGSGDGVAGGYPADRMRLMETNTLGAGTLIVSGNLAMSGTGTANLAFAAGTALVEGWEYENTASININVNGLAATTYYAVLAVNNATTALTVSKSTTGTTIPGYSVRLALFTALPAVPYLLLGTVTTNGTQVTAITPSYAQYAETRQLPYQSYAYMTGGSATLTNVNTQYDVAGYTASTVSSDNVFSVNTTTGEITVRRSGLYIIGYSASYSSGTTGQRNARLLVDGAQTQNASITPVAATAYMGVTWLHPVNAGQVVKVSTNTITTAGQSVASAYLTIARV